MKTTNNGTGLSGSTSIRSNAHAVPLRFDLRDYFAGKALSAILPPADGSSARDGLQEYAADYARVAYWMADAMLKARSL